MLVKNLALLALAAVAVDARKANLRRGKDGKVCRPRPSSTSVEAAQPTEQPPEEYAAPPPQVEATSAVTTEAAPEAPAPTEEAAHTEEPAPAPEHTEAPTEPAPTTEEPAPTTTEAAPEAPPPAADAPETFTGKATYYDVFHADQNHGATNGIGACQTQLSADGPFVALNNAQFDIDKPCGRTVVITDKETGNTVTATVQDRCAGCGWGNLDLTKGLFERMHNGLGKTEISWHWA